MKQRLALLTVLVTISTGCDDSATAADAFEPQADGRFVGLIEVVQSTSVAGELRTPIAAPDTVDVNVPFTATITTIGLHTCYREAGASIALSARRAVITPLDQIAANATGCFQALINLPRPVNVVFTQRGEATLRLEGRRLLDNDLRSATSVALEKRMYVR